MPSSTCVGSAALPDLEHWSLPCSVPPACLIPEFSGREGSGVEGKKRKTRRNSESEKFYCVFAEGVFFVFFQGVLKIGARGGSGEAVEDQEAETPTLASRGKNNMGSWEPSSAVGHPVTQ